MKKLISELTQHDWEYLEQKNGGIVLRSPSRQEYIYVVEAGRTVNEVVEAVWAWLRAHRHHKIRIDFGGFFCKEGPFIDEFVSLFQNVSEDGNGYYIGYVNVKGKKKLAELIEAFGYAPAEYCFDAEDYHEEWGLEIYEKVLFLWAETMNDGWGTHYYIRLEVAEEA